MRKEGLYSEELMRKVAETGSVQHLDEVPEHIKRLFRTAHDVTPYWHVRMQAAFQKYVDNAVSKTVNLRHEATTGDIEETYILAWKLKCKGITIYRDGSKSVQVIYRGTKTTKQEVKEAKKEEQSSPLMELTFEVKVDEKYLTVDSTFDPACPTGKCDN